MYVTPLSLLLIGQSKRIMLIRVKKDKYLRASCQRFQKVDHEGPSQKNDLSGLSWCIWPKVYMVSPSGGIDPPLGGFWGGQKWQFCPFRDFDSKSCTKFFPHL